MEVSLAACSSGALPAVWASSSSFSPAASSLLFLGRLRPSAAGLRAVGSRELNARKGFAPRASYSGAGALPPQLRESVDKLVKEHKVVLFMKGTKHFPQCGFSNTVVQILNSLDVPFEAVNILENDALRQGLKAYSNWPTFPQLYIDGEFFGGCDITLDSYQSGQLKEVIERAMCS